MNISFIGGGNMASAMIGGLLRNGTCRSDEIRVVEIDAGRQSQLKSLNVVVFGQQVDEAIIGSDIVVLAVKPQQMKASVAKLGKCLAPGQIVLSIAAGICLVDLEKWLGRQAGEVVLVRAMPNTPALIGAGITGLFSAPSITAQQREQVDKAMSATGSVVWLQSESDMDAVTAISGSGPAYFFYFIEALAQAGEELGLPEGTARKLAVETALGAAKLAHDSPEDPATLRARVTSKNLISCPRLLRIMAVK